MYLSILKKDLKRKRAMNVILLVFIILASMLVSSSISNIISVTTALDNYFNMANAPDYFVAIVNKSFNADVDNVINAASSVESYSKEKVIFMSSDQISFEDESIGISGGSNMLQSDISVNYFLEDNSILETVNKGEIYLIDRDVKNLGLEIGDKITVEIENVSREFTLAGSIKDAIFGANQLTIRRYIISEEDFDEFISAENTEINYGGSLVYIYSSDIETAISEIKPLVDNCALTMDRAFMKKCYIFDMIVTGILLVVSLILIAIAFVVLRFTIGFTLSEEFREIGVMKAIGIDNRKIRGLYLVKYAALSVIGAIIGLALSFPFGEMLMSISSKSIIIGSSNPILVNILCTALIIGVILLFCFGCTSKVKKMTPIDAIRNGQTGERFRKKSVMSLGKSKLPATPFLALNDIVSSPKRYGIITLTFFLCLSLMFILSATVSTMKSGSLYKAFNFADCDIYIESKMIMEFASKDGHEKLAEYLDDMEETLAENDMPARCFQEMMFNLPVVHGENKSNIYIIQGTGTTMDMYEYTAGTAPQNTNEIAITRLAADKLKVNIGDTVTIKTIDGDKEYIISAFFQSMYNTGNNIRLHSDEEINYIQSTGVINTQIIFTDNPDEKEIERRIDKIQKLYPDYEIETSAKEISNILGVTDTMDAVKFLVAILTIVLSALITVLMERSFIAKEQGEIALMKAMGIKNGKIYAYHALRFDIVGIIAVVIGEIFAMPLSHLCIDPLFKMMGMELAVDYVIDPFEMYLIFPLVVLLTTTAGAFLTSLYTRKIKASDTANIE